MYRLAAVVRSRRRGSILMFPAGRRTSATHVAGKTPALDTPVAKPHDLAPPTNAWGRPSLS